MINTNTLIIGQGLAGTLVAYSLYLQKIPFIVIDPVLENTSSRIAAGMFSPISGKRKTIDPVVLQQIPYAIKIYREIEQLLGSSFLHLPAVYQVYNGEREKKDILDKLVNPDFSKFITINPYPLPNIRQPFGAWELSHSGWVDCELLISSFNHWLKQNDLLISAEFVYDKLEILNERMEYEGLVFRNIVFCEGYQAVNNPFFKQELIIPCKGDVLTIEYNNLVTESIIKKGGIYLIPAGNGLFKAGATYQWNNDNEQPEGPEKLIIEEQLDAMLEDKYTTILHKAAIRPTTKNREVIAKKHPGHAHMFMLNGLGTKGVLRGPWWAKKVAKYCER